MYFYCSNTIVTGQICPFNVTFSKDIKFWERLGQANTGKKMAIEINLC